MLHHDPRSPAIEVEVADMLVATADGADDLIDRRLPPVLRLLRDRMHMDVVFVSAFRDGRRVFTHVERSPQAPLLEVGASDPLESSWCQRVVDGRLPEFMPDAGRYIESGDAPEPGIAIGTHLSTPIVLNDGQVYGTLCCFSTAVNPYVTADDLRKLRYTAKLVAWKMDHEAGGEHAPPPVHH